ncbi:unnamed protein product [Protopolystoma xenopodis]|uniref:Uncharacterized protein n=1 Tax=Protopolystoma xenopodis TaxID=117903 RepID=A0A3S5C7Z6_9PLAT|nr:unnamed protein product [Protopolystoma xenopodis]
MILFNLILFPRVPSRQSVRSYSSAISPRFLGSTEAAPKAYEKRNQAAAFPTMPNPCSESGQRRLQHSPEKVTGSGARSEYLAKHSKSTSSSSSSDETTAPTITLSSKGMLSRLGLPRP